jgi:CRP-like cAMP-binding protein
MSVTSGWTEAELSDIRDLPIVVRTFPPEQHVVRDGDRPSECCLIVKGFGLRSKTTAAGRRQILSIHVPGDIPDLQSLHLHVMDHDLVTLTECTLGFISHTALRKLHRQRPDIAELFWRDTLIDAAMFREWIVNLGQRPAPSRLAHVMAELHRRLQVIGMTDGRSFDMPLTQEQIADALGITSIHANRVIKQLRTEGIIDIHRGRVSILDQRKFEELADFDDRYMHQSPDL